MGIKLQLPRIMDLRPRLTVIGVGGAGCNAVNNMIAAGLTGVEFVVANTDAQALAASSAESRIQLGVNLTEGLGAGSRPEIGEAAAEEAIEELRGHISGSHMLFVAAGMGGGTGTGAAAVIARIAKELGVLTVGIVTKPFQFEGTRRQRIAEAGIAELKSNVDTLIVIPNQNLFRVANEKTTFAEAFVLADQVLYSGVACIVDLIVKEGLINLDFADVRTIMSGMGTAMMGTGEASGERRAIIAAEEAIANPLLDDITLKGAKGLLLSITGGRDLTLYEVDEAASRVREEVDPEANIIVGATFDETLGDRVRVSIVASGMARAGGEAGRVPGTPSPTNSGEPWPRVRTPQEQGTAGHGQGRAPGQGSSMPSAAGPQELQRQLAEAMQFGQPMPSPAVADGRGRAPQAPRETWRAPGNVTIEDGPPPLHGAHLHGAGAHAVVTGHPSELIDQGAAGTYGHAAQGSGALSDTFVPAAPAEVRRRPGRMPEIDEFPSVGQREYLAKTAGKTGTPAATQDRAIGAAHQPTDYERGNRKPSLFQRLTGIGRRGEESSDSPPRATAGVAQTGVDHPDSVPHNRGWAPSGPLPARADPGSRQMQEGVELPVFFNRERK